MERLSTFGHHSGDESDDYVGSSAATTVVRKTTGNNKGDRRTSNASLGTFPRQSMENDHKYLHQRQRSVRQPSLINPLNFINFNTTYTGQQLLLTSGDIEAMTMRQFRMGSLGC